MMRGENVMSPGNVPVNHRVHLKDVDRRVRTTELVLRCGVCVLGLVAVILIVTDTQAREFFTVRKVAKFTSMKSLVFLVTVNAIAAAYSVVQGGRCIVSMVRGSVMYSKGLAWAIFSADQVMAYLAIVTVSVALQASTFGQFGEPIFQWMKLCNMYSRYCKQAGEGAAMAIIASILMVAISGVSAFTLFRLYGKMQK